VKIDGTRSRDTGTWLRETGKCKNTEPSTCSAMTTRNKKEVKKTPPKWTDPHRVEFFWWHGNIVKDVVNCVCVCVCMSFSFWENGLLDFGDGGNRGRQLVSQW
jgi:hypothetical protein